MYNPEKTIVIDLETTGLNPIHNEILQVAIIDGNGKVLLNEYCKPKHTQTWPEAEAINHITPEIVADKPKFKKIIPEINKILKKADTIIGYNIEFDLTQLLCNGVSKKHIVHKKIHDVMLEFADIYGEKLPNGKQKWQKLTKCAEYYDYKYDNAHDALDDVKATLHCFKKIHEIK